MSYGLAQRSRVHVLGESGGEFVPRWRVVAPCVLAKGMDNRLQHCYGGDLLDWLSDEQAAHFMRLNLVERIDTDPQDAIAAADDAPAEPVDLDLDTDTPTPDTDAVDECVATLARLQVPTAAGAPACRTALRGNGFRYSNAVVASAVKRRKELFGSEADAEAAEDFEVVVP
jgi:hypothetical protein